MGSQSKKWSSRNRRLLAFYSSVFGLTVALPTPVDFVVLPLYLGLKLYRLLAVFLVFKSAVNFQFVAVLLSFTGSPAGLVAEVEQMDYDSALMMMAGLAALDIGLITLLIVILVIPTVIIRRKIYPQIKHLVK